MHPLPPAMTLLLRPFAPHFSRRVWVQVQILLTGAILAPAQRTVTAMLRVMGLGASPHFPRSHRVLNQGRWGERRCRRDEGVVHPLELVRQRFRPLTHGVALLPCRTNRVNRLRVFAR